MPRVMYTLPEAIELIDQGKRLLIAADEELLRKLPRGTWIGGSIPYFMSENGGLFSRELLQITEVPDYVGDIKVSLYEKSRLSRIPADAPAHGVSFMIITAGSPAHLAFAQEAPDYPDIFSTPLIGWNAGVALEDLGKRTPFVFDGRTGRASDDAAVVLHASLPKSKVAVIDIANIFTPGNGDEIRFEETGFTQKTAIIGGKRTSFAGYIKEHGVDTRLPLVANYSGAMINTSFQRIDETSGVVHLYAPVFANVAYKIASPVGDYPEEIAKELQRIGEEPVFACNCILNYLYGKLEGRRTGAITGPITFGEIAYQQLNQTMALLTIRDA